MELTFQPPLPPPSTWDSLWKNHVPKDYYDMETMCRTCGPEWGVHFHAWCPGAHQKVFRE